MSFPVEGGDHDWLVSRMDVIKLFEPILRPRKSPGLHAIRGVVIDAGHGGSDNGATSRLGSEKNYTIDTALAAGAILNDAGHEDGLHAPHRHLRRSLRARAHRLALFGLCFVSIHFNSASEEARGLETYCLSPRGAASTSSRYLTRGDIQKLPGNDDDTQNILLASMVHSEIIKLNPGDASADRGVKRARFVVIKMNQLPAILVEGGFVSNHMEAARVNRPDYRQSLAQAIARGRDPVRQRDGRPAHGAARATVEPRHGGAGAAGRVLAAPLRPRARVRAWRTAGQQLVAEARRKAAPAVAPTPTTSHK